jgi:hypothetical protein
MNGTNVASFEKADHDVTLSSPASSDGSQYHKLFFIEEYKKSFQPRGFFNF